MTSHPAFQFGFLPSLIQGPSQEGFLSGNESEPDNANLPKSESVAVTQTLLDEVGGYYGLCKQLNKNKYIRTVNVYSDAIPKDFMVFCDFLKDARAHNITSLILHDGWSDSQAADSLVDSLSEVLKANTTITTLTLHGKWSDLSALTNALKMNKTLTSLKLLGNWNDFSAAAAVFSKELRKGLTITLDKDHSMVEEPEETNDSGNVYKQKKSSEKAKTCLEPLFIECSESSSELFTAVRNESCQWSDVLCCEGFVLSTDYFTLAVRDEKLFYLHFGWRSNLIKIVLESREDSVSTELWKTLSGNIHQFLEIILELLCTKLQNIAKMKCEFKVGKREESSKYKIHNFPGCLDDNCIQLSSTGWDLEASSIYWSQINEDKKDAPTPVEIFRLLLELCHVWTTLGLGNVFSLAGSDQTLLERDDQLRCLMWTRLGNVFGLADSDQTLLERDKSDDQLRCFKTLMKWVKAGSPEEKQLSKQPQEGQASYPKYEKEEIPEKKKKTLTTSGDASSSYEVEYSMEDANEEKAQSRTTSEMSAHLPVKLIMKVVVLCDEWGSSKGGLSTFNRHLAIYLAKRSALDVICYLLDVSVDDVKAAKENCVTLIKAEFLPGNNDPFASQYRLPTELQSPDVIISHGRKFGCSAYLIKEMFKSCKWIHFVHVDCKEMGQNKAGFDEIGANNKKDRNELDLCKSADVVVVVGPRLLKRYQKILPKKPVNVFYPGLSIEFKNPDPNYESKEGDGRNDFQIYIFGRCSVEDFELKGFDIAAKAVGTLAEHYKLNIVGVPEGEEENIKKHTLDTTGLKKSQLFVGTYCKSREEMIEKMCEADLVIMPSRAEAFGLVGLEALTFGVPLLVSAASGLGMTLMELNFGHTFVVDSHDSQEWAARIESMKKKKRSQRIEEVIQMRNQYERKYKWEDQCDNLI